MKCNNCGFTSSGDFKFCPECGGRVEEKTVVKEEPKTENGLTFTDEALMTAYITGSVDKPKRKSRALQHYLYIFARFSRGGVISWNWWSAFFGPVHLLYRKNYLFGFLILFAPLILQISCSVLSIIPLLSTFILTLPYIFAFIAEGMFFDRLQYNRYCSKLEDAIKTYPYDFEKQKEYMADKGGVNVALLIIIISMVIILLLVIGLIGAFFGWAINGIIGLFN